jgi:hypothetical protein
LSPDSNITRFQRRFTLVPEDDNAEPELADRDILELVFHRVVDPGRSLLQLLDDLPQDTTLQRAYVTHLRCGNHWLTRTGTFPFQATNSRYGNVA